MEILYVIDPHSGRVKLNEGRSEALLLRSRRERTGRVLVCLHWRHDLDCVDTDGTSVVLGLLGKAVRAPRPTRSQRCKVSNIPDACCVWDVDYSEKVFVRVLWHARRSRHHVHVRVHSVHVRRRAGIPGNSSVPCAFCLEKHDAVSSHCSIFEFGPLTPYTDGLIKRPCLASLPDARKISKWVSSP